MARPRLELGTPRFSRMIGPVQRGGEPSSTPSRVAAAAARRIRYQDVAAQRNRAYLAATERSRGARPRVSNRQLDPVWTPSPPRPDPRTAPKPAK
jgi:hypothetical protein